MNDYFELSAKTKILWDTREEMYKDILTGGVGAEIGVFNGDNSSNLLEIVEPKKLYLIDRWVMQKAPAELIEEHDARKANVYATLGEDPRVEILEMSSEDASYEIPKKSLDWLFIDGNHAYAAALWDLQLYLPLVKVGGIVMLHDFTIHISHGAVIEAVDYQLRTHGDMEVIGKTREYNRSELKEPTIALKKTRHKEIYKTWW